MQPWWRDYTINRTALETLGRPGMGQRRPGSLLRGAMARRRYAGARGGAAEIRRSISARVLPAVRPFLACFYFALSQPPSI
eukprot:141297-Pyramimonas_sp.AAC.1